MVDRLVFGVNGFVFDFMCYIGLIVDCIWCEIWIELYDWIVVCKDCFWCYLIVVKVCCDRIRYGWCVIFYGGFVYVWYYWYDGLLVIFVSYYVVCYVFFGLLVVFGIVICSRGVCWFSLRCVLYMCIVGCNGKIVCYVVDMCIFLVLIKSVLSFILSGMIFLFLKWSVIRVWCFGSFVCKKFVCVCFGSVRLVSLKVSFGVGYLICWFVGVLF